MDQDYYKILGVNRNASQTDIQKAYRKMARKHHPDVAEDKKTAKAEFQKIQKAYDVLSDSEKRELYDRYGSSFETMGGGGGGGGRQQRPGAGGFDEIDISQLFGGRGGGTGGFGGFEDLFEQFTRGGAGRQQRGPRPSQRGGDLTASVSVPLQTAVTGGNVDMQVRRTDGKMESISVKIPAGIESGKKIRLRGQGQPSPTGSKAGDLLITVHVQPHTHFERRDKNLYLKVPVTLAEAALGGKVDIPTPKGTISLTIPPGTSSGKRLRLKGMGVQTKEAPGDLFAEVLITLPDQLDDDAKEQIRKLADGQPNPRGDLSW